MHPAIAESAPPSDHRLAACGCRNTVRSTPCSLHPRRCLISKFLRKVARCFPTGQVATFFTVISLSIALTQHPASRSFFSFVFSSANCGGRFALDATTPRTRHSAGERLRCPSRYDGTRLLSGIRPPDPAGLRASPNGTARKSDNTPPNSSIPAVPLRREVSSGGALPRPPNGRAVAGQ
jgi:hypothetical protein